MKTIAHATLVILLAISTSCTNNANLEAEKQAIIDVIENESAGVTNLDYNQWAKHWVQNEHASFVWTSSNNHIYKSSWDEIDPWVQSSLENMKDVDKLEKQNFKIHINGNSALVFYDESAYNANNELLYELLTTKLLEKINGTWKIAYNSNVNKSSFQKNQTIEKEKAAIRAVIENETNSFFNRDFEQQKKSFLMNDDIVALYAGKNNYGQYIGWDNINAAYDNIYAQNPNPVASKITFENYRIKVFPETALAIYDQVEHSASKDKKVTKSVRFLEKVNGEWKISFYSWIDGFSYEEQPD